MICWYHLKIIFAVSGEDNDIKYSARILENVSPRDNITCLDDTAAVPDAFGSKEVGKIWIKITDLELREELIADMFVVASTGSNIKQVISTSQFHFGYVNILE